MKDSHEILMIACGALAREIETLKQLNQMKFWKIRFLPARWHNHPQKILEGIEKILEETNGRYSRIFVAYADCGNGGMFDRLIENYGVERLPGAHCYESFSGTQNFEKMMVEEPGTFFLTDFLVKTFDQLVFRELGLDRHPELKEEYFRHYKRLVYLAQTVDSELRTKAKQAAELLELKYEYRYTGYGDLETVLNSWKQNSLYGKTDQHLLA